MVTERSSKRVAQSTVTVYAEAIIPFMQYVNRSPERTILSRDSLSYLLGMYGASARDCQLRPLHAAARFFFPEVPRDRLTAELKGLEKSTKRTPTTPFTLPLLVAFAVFTSQRVGLGAAVGVIVAFFGLLRTAEVIKIRPIDVILRTSYIAITTIRLTSTKSGREQVVQFEPNSVAERALKHLLLSRDFRQYQGLFGFRTYRDLYQLVMEFKCHFQLTLPLTPHSLRAGGATYLRLCGFSMTVIADIGRWEAVITARGYVDIVFTLLPETKSAEARVYPTATSSLRVFVVGPW